MFRPALRLGPSFRRQNGPGENHQCGPKVPGTLDFLIRRLAAGRFHKNKEQAGTGIHALESLGFCRERMDVEPLQGDAPIERGVRADPRVER